MTIGKQNAIKQVSETTTSGKLPSTKGYQWPKEARNMKSIFPKNLYKKCSYHEFFLVECAIPHLQKYIFL